MTITATNVDTCTVQSILSHIETFINQRAGLDPANYGCHPEQLKYSTREQRIDARRSMAQDARTIAADGKRARLALAEARSYPADYAALMDGFGAFSGRLTWDNDGLSYCTGQYYPTEYRKAAAAVLERYCNTVRPKSTPGGKIPRDMDELQAMNYAAGGCFFDRGNMKAFRSRVLPDIYGGGGGVFFVTSEQNYNGTARHFTVRRFDPADGDVNTFGDFNGLSRAAAIRVARAAAMSNPPLCDRCGGNEIKYGQACWSCKGTGRR